ncbi:hypothetical protein SJ954_09070, partial [Enterococcus faecium]|nr:hypothetical protein [Enterococcus faecium]
NLSQNVVHSDSDLILHNSSVLIDKEPNFFHTDVLAYSFFFSSIIAPALIQPALAFLILTG